jgi:threonine/homoserine/homoserine lactone efflux protein
MFLGFLMSGILNFQLFVISAIIIVMAPGPDFLYVTTRGISQGKKAGVLSALGISVGLLIHTILAAFGLSAIIQASRIAYLVIKYIGAAYLVYLGIKTILSKKQQEETAGAENFKKGAFHQGILTNVFNPKAIVTFMAFLPQFVDSRISHPIAQFTLLGCILALVAAIWFSFTGYFSGLIGNFIKNSHHFQNGIKYLSGSVLVLLGLRLAATNE